LKIVFDTNVILSAFFTEGLSYKVFDECLNNFDIVISKWIISEIEEKLRHKFKIPNPQINQLTKFLRTNLINLEPTGPLPKVCRDNDDNNVLKLADFSRADVIVTGDKDLLVLKSYLGAKIMNPRQFFEKYLQ